MNYPQLHKKSSIYEKCQVSPFAVLCGPLSSPTLLSHISYLSCSQYPFLHPENNAFVLLHLLPIPPSPSIPPSICLVLSVTSLPCQAMRERGRDRPCYCPRTNPRNINSVFLEQERQALASNLSDLMMSGPLIFGPFIWFPSSSSLLSNRVLAPRHKRQCRIVCAVWLIRALHQLSLTHAKLSATVPTSPPSLMRKLSVYECPSERPSTRGTSLLSALKIIFAHQWNCFVWLVHLWLGAKKWDLEFCVTDISIESYLLQTYT